ncbi:OLC1v1002281C1 [Oldenlandia corymbosa var. corymbosa]|uniref:OLC1v1002281C1 n=1 Tax=Oldenlandia corymbosa var. corymbosa TaxID=529605 RepID=A0AAV1DA67_OLDCO|nr:OLC1v1002281C1 [Oldenlandia corymbosa var. corymbosa]
MAEIKQKLTGSIPSNVGNCTSLEEIYLNTNNFVGSIPESIENLEHLVYFDVSDNTLEGNLPFLSGNCKEMDTLALSDNQLDGSIPSAWGNWQLKKLKLLYLNYNHDNQLEGRIPAELGMLSELETLYLYTNHLSGEIPKSIWKIRSLQRLAVYQNNLTGELPIEILELKQLKNLYLFENEFSGVIPRGFGINSSLEILDLTDNQFTGNIPPNLCFRNRLVLLNLGRNNFQESTQWSAAFFCGFGNMSKLKVLDLGKNGFHNTNLPSSLCKLEMLEYLVLSDNKFTGVIPDCFTSLTKLTVLSLRHNGFRGMIPSNFPEGNALRNLGLNGNQLEGPLPKSLLNCTSLEILDVGQNNITDTFPMWLGSLPELSVLMLKLNHFHGIIGTIPVKSFQKLQILDLSHNQFCGFLPPEMMDGFQAMKENDSRIQLKNTSARPYYEDSVTLVIKGFEHELKRVLTIYTAIDLSCNQFEGSIPKSLTKLNSLRILNCSNNNFDGVIPSTIGNLSSLESLDLSVNQLDGQIPSGLANLNFLSTLNLSQNQLVGRIPTGRQLNTFSPYSYGENPGLCGFPLEDCRVLPNGQQMQSSSSHRQTDDHAFMEGFTWESVVLGFGCGLIVGLLMGDLLFNSNWPKRLNAIVKDIHKHQNNRKVIQQIHSRLVINSTEKSFQFVRLWNFILRHYGLGDFPQEAVFLFKSLHHNRCQDSIFDSFTYCFLIKAGANLADASLAKQIHCCCSKVGFENHVYVQTGLVDMYMGCRCTVEALNVFDEMPERNSVTWNALLTGFIRWGDLTSARSVFDGMPEKNVVSWTGMIDGYTRICQFNEALSLLREMAHHGVKFSEVTLLAVFPAIWNLKSIQLCQMVHAYGEKSGYNAFDIRVMNCLIDTYAKCGSMECAVKVFDEILDERKNVVTWTSIISGFAMHGLAKEATERYRRMINTGLKPNRITFLSLINSCSHGGLVDEGIEIFKRMVNECGIVPDIKHYGSLIDMLGRVGRLEEAEMIAAEIPSDQSNAFVWRTLLSACSFYGEVEIGVRVTKKIMEVERKYGGDYVVLSNIFASTGRFMDSEKVRKDMDDANAAKVTGLSSF